MDERYLIRTTLPPWFLVLASAGVLAAGLPSRLWAVALAASSEEVWKVVLGVGGLLVLVLPPVGWVVHHFVRMAAPLFKADYVQAPRPAVLEEFHSESLSELPPVGPDAAFVISFYSSAPQNIIDWVVRRRTHYMVAVGIAVCGVLGVLAGLALVLGLWGLSTLPMAVGILELALSVWIFVSGRKAWTEADEVEQLWFVVSRDSALRDLLKATSLE